MSKIEAARPAPETHAPMRGLLVKPLLHPLFTLLLKFVLSMMPPGGNWTPRQIGPAQAAVNAAAIAVLPFVPHARVFVFVPLAEPLLLVETTTCVALVKAVIVPTGSTSTEEICAAPPTPQHVPSISLPTSAAEKGPLATVTVGVVVVAGIV